MTPCLQLLQAFDFLIRQAAGSCNESIGLDDARNLHSHRERLRAASGSCSNKALVISVDCSVLDYSLVIVAPCFEKIGRYHIDHGYIAID